MQFDYDTRMEWRLANAKDPNGRTAILDLNSMAWNIDTDTSWHPHLPGYFLGIALPKEGGYLWDSQINNYEFYSILRLDMTPCTF